MAFSISSTYTPLGRENSAFQFESFAQKMPVKSSYTDTIKPANPAELQKKIIDKENGAQGIVDDVRKELGKLGYGSWYKSEKETLDVSLLGMKCIVFLVHGKFKVGEDELSQRGLGYPVEKEKTIQLQPSTGVVIIRDD